jgi:hypothetical protein
MKGCFRTLAAMSPAHGHRAVRIRGNSAGNKGESLNQSAQRCVDARERTILVLFFLPDPAVAVIEIAGKRLHDVQACTDFHAHYFADCALL